LRRRPRPALSPVVAAYARRAWLCDRRRRRGVVAAEAYAAAAAPAARSLSRHRGTGRNGAGLAEPATGLALLAAEPVGRAASTGKRVAASLFVFSRAGGAGADSAVSPTFSSAFEMGLNLLTNKVYIDIRHIYILVCRIM